MLAHVWIWMLALARSKRSNNHRVLLFTVVLGAALQDLGTSYYAHWRGAYSKLLDCLMRRTASSEQKPASEPPRHAADPTSPVFIAILGILPSLGTTNHWYVTELSCKCPCSGIEYCRLLYIWMTAIWHTNEAPKFPSIGTSWWNHKNNQDWGFRRLHEGIAGIVRIATYLLSNAHTI